MRVVRPKDAAELYSFPRPEFARLWHLGLLHRLASGYYAIVPADQTDREWLPELEAAALGIAAADQGADAVALMGLSAARVHGAIPRALGVAVVAAAGHRTELALLDRDARVVFARRDVRGLDCERRPNELGHGLVTTVEQTLLDLAARPDLGRLPDEARAAAKALLPRADQATLRELATAQRRGAVLDRLLAGV
jgi:predicted transcriptional regulator of viral defense system